MRVMLVSGSHPPLRCGVGDYVAALANALAGEAGIETSVLTSAGAEPLNGGRVTVLPLMRDWRLSELATFVRAVNRFAPDIVHIQYPTQGYGRKRLPYLLPWMTRLLGRRAVVTWHEPVSSHAKGVLAALFAVAAAAIVVVRGNFRDLMHPGQRWIAAWRPMPFIANASTIPVVQLDAAGVAAERRRHGVADGQRLVLFFGFLMASKGAEHLFAIADPARDRLVIIGASPDGDDCQQRLQERAAQADWQGRVGFAGFLPGEAVGRLLAAADAVVLPYRDGAGHWNTSVHAVQMNGTFLVTTSRNAAGDDPANNTWWCRPDDVAGMRAALSQGIGRKSPPRPAHGWSEIAQEHARVYARALGR